MLPHAYIRKRQKRIKSKMQAKTKTQMNAKEKKEDAEKRNLRRLKVSKIMIPVRFCD